MMMKNIASQNNLALTYTFNGFPSVCSLFSQFFRAGTVSQKCDNSVPVLKNCENQGTVSQKGNKSVRVLKNCENHLKTIAKRYYFFRTGHEVPTFWQPCHGDKNAFFDV